MKKLLIGVGILVLLLVIAVVAIPFFVPVDSLKAELVTKVKEATGRDLRVEGPVSFSILPSIALVAQNVSFSNPPGASSPDMARFSKLDVALKLMPLLSRRVEIAKLTLVDPVINLEIDKQGRPNWQFGAAAAAAKPTSPAPAAPATPAGGGGASLSGLELDDVGLDNGTLSYVDQRSGEKLELDKVSMRLSLPGLDSPFKADGSAVYRGEKMSLTMTVADPGSLMREKGSAATVKLDSKPVAFDFSGSAAGTTPLKLDGTVSLKVPSVRGLAQWAGVAFNAPGTGFGLLAISGKVSYAGNKIGFSEAKLSLDQINAQGELAVDTGGARPSLKGKLDVDKLDVNPYLAPETAAKSSGGGAGWSDTPLELGALKAADIDFNLTANSLLYRKLQIGKSALAMHLKDGRFEADLAQLALYQGSGKGKVVVDGSGSVPAIEAQVALSQVQLEPLLKDYMAMDRLSGVGAINFNVTGHGKSERDIIGTLGGNGNLNVANGKIKGMNLVAMVKNVGSAFEGGSKSTQETDFTSLTGTFTIVNGIAHNNDLQLKSADVPMTGAGTIDLPRRTVDYKVTPRLAGVAVAVNIKGPWDNLSYQPDLAGMGSELLKGGAKGVEGAIKKNPADALKGLLGR
ncbi:MAG TPA: AsmA family protein [Stellaceae bacterium]|nr:AsmA family protein [Stellaceae bacterium]